jgi:uncharacterized protein YkwD
MFAHRRGSAPRVAAIALAATLSLGSLAAPAEALSPLESRLFKRVNVARQNQGMRRLQVSAWLSRKARGHSIRMARRGSLYHTRCLSCMFRSRRWSRIGENVGLAATVLRVHRLMMRSPSHRSNILGRGYNRIGVGVRKNHRGVWVTEIFWG